MMKHRTGARPLPTTLALHSLWAAALLGASALAMAQANTPANSLTGTAKQGEAIASAGLPPTVAACASCHGARGEGMATFPSLAGTCAGYIQAQLAAFADGSRNNAVMAPIAKGLNAQARADVAAYYASLPSGIAPVAGKASATDKGAWLVERGRMADGIPACASCHGPGGAGVGAQFPPIAKLNAAYMQAQMDAWKSGSRGPGPLGLMEGIAKKLSHDDVSAIAQYYASQASAKP